MRPWEIDANLFTVYLFHLLLCLVVFHVTQSCSILDLPGMGWEKWKGLKRCLYNISCSASNRVSKKEQLDSSVVTSTLDVSCKYQQSHKSLNHGESTFIDHYNESWRLCNKAGIHSSDPTVADKARELRLMYKGHNTSYEIFVNCPGT